MKQTPIKIPGLGKKRLEILALEGIHCLEDIVHILPRNWLDKTRISPLSNARIDNFNQIKVSVTRTQKISRGKRPRLIVEARDKHADIDLVFFSAVNHWEKVFTEGSEWICWGRITRYGKLQMVHPEIEDCHQEFEPKVVALYPQPESWKSSRVDQKFLRKIIDFALNATSLHIENDLPDQIIEAFNLLPKREILNLLHHPKTLGQAYKAKRQLKLEEILPSAIELSSKKHHYKHHGCEHQDIKGIQEQILKQLPFQLTTHQEKALLEINTGLNSKSCYNALIQGDVGSGKTVIAALAMAHVIGGGFQTCIMAPTEILAKQHFRKFSEWFTPLGIECRLLTGSTPASARTSLLADLHAKRIQILIGTHALITKSVEFGNLGLIVIDEQHRFGVEQRESLISKGHKPDLLAMTATPIPRSLAMTWYGDFQHVNILGKPEGRQPIKSRVVPYKKRQGLLEWVVDQAQQGQRTYWVLPRITDEEDGKASVQEVYNQILSIYPNGLQSEVAFVHGKLAEDEKQCALDQFSVGDVKILISTTVIEVGVDVPDATIMIIEGADNFGLSQLHQLRGRVGRGKLASWCFLLSGSQDEIVMEKLHQFSSTEDGFQIADMDLEWRGAGNLTGNRQSGQRPYKFFNFIEDLELIQEVKEILDDMFTDELFNKTSQKWIKDITQGALL